MADVRTLDLNTLDPVALDKQIEVLEWLIDNTTFLDEDEEQLLNILGFLSGIKEALETPEKPYVVRPEGMPYINDQINIFWEDGQIYEAGVISIIKNTEDGYQLGILINDQMFVGIQTFTWPHLQLMIKAASEEKPE